MTTEPPEGHEQPRRRRTLSPRSARDQRPLAGQRIPRGHVSTLLVVFFTCPKSSKRRASTALPAANFPVSGMERRPPGSSFMNLLAIHRPRLIGAHALTKDMSLERAAADPTRAGGDRRRLALTTAHRATRAERPEGLQRPDPRDRLPRPVHGRARRLDRERRAPGDRPRSALQLDRPAMGRQRLRPDLRRVPAPRRPARRPVRPAPHLPRRPRPVLTRQPARRPGPELRRADGGPGAAGTRRRGALPRDAHHHHDDLHRPAGAHPGHRHLELRRRERAALSARIAGGVLTTYLSWRWVLFVNVPIGALVAFGAVALLHEARRPDASHSLDIAGSHHRNGRARGGRLRHRQHRHPPVGLGPHPHHARHRAGAARRLPA